MSQTCHHHNQKKPEQHSCHGDANKPDTLFRVTASIVTFLYLHYWLDSELYHSGEHTGGWYSVLAHSVFELVNTVWPGVVIGIVMLALLSTIPRELVMSLLGTNQGTKGILRAAAAGVFLDLCSHGILMVGAKLYERGASIGQVMAFLIASPWNSFSLTLILITLIGLPWTLAFILLSALIAIATGMMFDVLVAKNKLPVNPQQSNLPEDFDRTQAFRQLLREANYSIGAITATLLTGIKESRTVVRWLFVGVILASLIRAFVPADIFGDFFGPTLAGLGLTMLAATIIEVCSEGSAPIAADLLTRAQAPGNSFAFLMAGVSTDYTEIMVLKDTTRSWKLALFLPLLTLPQIVIVAWLINIAV